jgi:hypothetical protein
LMVQTRSSPILKLVLSHFRIHSTCKLDVGPLVLCLSFHLIVSITILFARYSLNEHIQRTSSSDRLNSIDSPRRES